MADEVDFFEQPDDIVSGSAESVTFRITNYVREVRDLYLQKNDIEAKLKDINIAIADLELKKIPDALTEAGLSEIKTLDGMTVGTKIFVGAIPAEMKATAYEWIDKNGDSGIIKREVKVNFNKGATDAAIAAMAKLEDLGLQPRMTLDVHYQTFSAYAKEQVNKGRPLPLDKWGVFYGYKAYIK